MEGVWKKIDLWPEGKAGIEARYKWVPGKTLHVYIPGTNHILDWIHHFMPGQVERENDAAWLLYRRLNPYITHEKVTILGHSLGAAVACALWNLMYKSDSILVICGGKRYWKSLPRASILAFIHIFRHKGDIIPFLPPWRPAYLKRDEKVFGKWTFPWKAHFKYRDIYDKYGF